MMKRRFFKPLTIIFTLMISHLTWGSEEGRGEGPRTASSFCGQSIEDLKQYTSIDWYQTENYGFIHDKEADKYYQTEIQKNKTTFVFETKCAKEVFLLLKNYEGREQALKDQLEKLKNKPTWITQLKEDKNLKAAFAASLVLGGITVKKINVLWKAMISRPKVSAPIVAILAFGFGIYINQGATS